MRRIMMAAALAVISAPSGALTKCVHPDGRVAYTDGDCTGLWRRAPISADESSSFSGLRPGERALLDRIERREAEERWVRDDERRFERRHSLTFGDRKRIRELTMRKNDLLDSLRRGGMTQDRQFAVEEELHHINRQIEQIQQPKW